jgi:hypothetical protein
MSLFTSAAIVRYLQIVIIYLVLHQNYYVMIYTKVADFNSLMA